MSISIITPIFFKEWHPVISAFASHYKALLRNNPSLELIIVDSSPKNIFDSIDSFYENEPQIRHVAFTEDVEFKNKKTIAIKKALTLCKSEIVILCDDDLFLSEKNILEIQDELKSNDLVIGNISCKKLSLDLAFQACEQFFSNVLSGSLQPNGHAAFRRSVWDEIGPFDDAVLFDDLAIIRHFQKFEKRVRFAKQIHIEVQSKGRSHFILQRLRYAYETLAFPFLSLLLLSIIPISFLLPPTFHIFLCSVILALACVGYLKNDVGFFPVYTPLAAIFLVYTYIVFIWPALILKLTGRGIYFGDARIQRIV